MRRLMSALLALCLFCGCTSETKTVNQNRAVEDIVLTFDKTITMVTADAENSGAPVDVGLEEMNISFTRLPQNVNELSEINRTGENGKYVTAALLVSAYKTWNTDNQEECCEMMKVLMNSPTIPNSYTQHTEEFVRARMLQNDKWEYIADAYLNGAVPGNGYTPNQPPSITLREYPYAPLTSNFYGPELIIEKIVFDFSGADNERSVSVYEDPVDHQWYIWSDSYGSLLADIKMPQ